MIDLKACLDEKHVIDVVGNDRNKQSIFEKYVYSMSLLEQIDHLLGQKHYVFKGGTSLLLLFDQSSRFSIDIDICMNEEEFDNRNKLEKLFQERLCEPFVGVKKDVERGHGGKSIKAAHYLFSYIPKYQADEEYILLDIVFQDSVIQGKPISVDNPSLIQNGEPKKVNTIAIDDLLGDKLTAFAPNTIGVKYIAKDQYGRPKCTEIIKQLYDCAFLTNHYCDIERVKNVYENIAEYQIMCGNDKQLTIAKCLIDTIQTCELILSGGYRDKNKYNLLVSGMKNFNDYVIGNAITSYDLQKYAFSVDIVASRLLRLFNPLVNAENKLDFFVRTGIKEKELKLIADEESLDNFYKHCLLSISK